MNGEQIKKENKGPEAIPEHLLDGFDGGTPVDEEHVAQLLENAPPRVKERIAEWAKQRKELG